MKESRDRPSTATTSASFTFSSSCGAPAIRGAPCTLRNARSPPNSAPAAAAITIRFEEAKKVAEVIACPSSWPSRKRASRRAMFRIQAARTTAMWVLMVEARPRVSRRSKGS